jgi:ketosteroid isomerase-like protein
VALSTSDTSAIRAAEEALAAAFESSDRTAWVDFWVSWPNGSDALTVRRRFLMAWRREPDGRWRIARELLNEDV